MTLVSLNTIWAWPGLTGAQTSSTPAFATATTLDASGEYVCNVFAAREAMTISHVGWMTNTVSGSPTADTRIETVGTDGIPTGTLWATNTNIISGTLSATTFTLHALTAAASIARGQIFAVKALYNSGTNFLVRGSINNVAIKNSSMPYRITNTGTPTKTTLHTTFSPWALGSSTTQFYALDKVLPLTALTSSAFSNSVAGAKRGMRFQVPFPCRCAGLSWLNSTSVGDYNAILYNDAGTELSSSSTAFEGDQSAADTGGAAIAFFDNAVTLNPNTWYRAVVEPSSATNITVGFATLPSAAYRTAWPGNTSHHYTTFTTAGGWVDSATDQVPWMDILIDQIERGGASPTYALGI